MRHTPDKVALQERVIQIANLVLWEGIEEPPGFVRSGRSQNVDDYIEFDFRKIQHNNNLDGWFDIVVWIEGPTDAAYWKEKFVAFENEIATAYPRLSDFLFESFAGGVSTYDSFQLAETFPFHVAARLSDFLSIRRLIRLIIDYLNRPAIDLWTLWSLGHFNGAVVVKNGKLEFDPPWYLKPFEGTDVSRIRRCPYCTNAFLQSRKNQNYCSRNCRDNARGKKYRENHKEEISERRSRAYLKKLGRPGPKKVLRKKL